MCLKMYHVRLFIVEKMGFGTTPRQCKIHSKPQPLLQKTCISYAFETLAVTQECVCVCMLWSAYIGHGPHTQAEGHLAILFSKKIFSYLKVYIFHFNTPQINSISD